MVAVSLLWRRVLACAFVAELPDNISRTIQARSRAEGLDLIPVLVWVRAVLSDECVAAAGASTLQLTDQCH